MSFLWDNVLNLSPPGPGEDNIQVSGAVTPGVPSAITAQQPGWTEERWQVRKEVWDYVAVVKLMRQLRTFKLNIIGC